MRAAVPMALLVAVGAFGWPDDSTRVARDSALAYALHAALVAESDLGWKPNLTDPDPFRLRLVDAMMLHPLSTADSAAAIASTLSKSPGASAVLDCGRRVLPESARVHVDPAPIHLITTGAFENIESLARAIAADVVYARELCNSAWNGVSGDERAWLLHDGFTMLLEPEEVARIEGDTTKPAVGSRDLLAVEDSNRLYFATASRVRRELILEAAWRLLTAADTLAAPRDYLSLVGVRGDLRVPSWLNVSGDLLYFAEEDSVSIAVGGPSDNVWRTLPDVVLEVGGDDVYVAERPDSRVTLIVDLAGDDTYIAAGDFAWGAAKDGVSVLLDVAGDDNYRARHYSMGTALYGAGVLVDLAGDDVYRGGNVCEGAAAFGFGVLVDNAGNDDYAGTEFDQGFGFVGGYGALVDADGNDTYRAGFKYHDFREPETQYASLSQGFGFGLRPWASGGVGVLYDGAGNDTYIGDYFSQGSSYWYAFGLLWDARGNDKYIARRYSQGAGIHLSVGALVDCGGDDNYATWGVSLGCGHDYAYGLLWDRAGNDVYQADWLSLGAGNANGTGLFVDDAGDDVYEFRGQQCLGWGTYDETRRYGSIGIFLDLSGHDEYNRKGSDGGAWLEGEVGVGVDGR